MADEVPICYQHRGSGKMLCLKCAQPHIKVPNLLCPWYVINFGIYTQNCHECGVVILQGQVKTQFIDSPRMVQ